MLTRGQCTWTECRWPLIAGECMEYFFSISFDGAFVSWICHSATHLPKSKTFEVCKQKSDCDASRLSFFLPNNAVAKRDMCCGECMVVDCRTYSWMSRELLFVSRVKFRLFPLITVHACACVCARVWSSIVFSHTRTRRNSHGVTLVESVKRRPGIKNLVYSTCQSQTGPVNRC